VVARAGRAFGLSRLGTLSQSTNQLSCSHNELTALLTKAAVASGCPFGVAEEVARAGCLLQAQNARGVARTLSALERVSRERSSGNGETGFAAPRCREFAHLCVAIEGLALLDVAIAAGFEPEPASISVEEVDSLELLLALMVVLHQDTSLEFKVTLSDGSHVTIADGQTCTICELISIDKVTTPASGCIDSTTAQNTGYGPLTLTLIRQSTSVDSQAMHQPGKHNALDQLSVNPADWAAATRLAEKTYVPASESSRLGGAGAGLTDND